MALDYISAGNGPGQWIYKIVAIDHDTSNIHCKFDVAIQGNSGFVDGGLRLMDETLSNVIGGIDEYYSSNTNPHTFNLSYAVNLTAGQRVCLVLQSSGAVYTDANAPCFRNIQISADPIA